MLSKALTKLLADTYTLYMQTQNFHWNVQGSSFLSLHLMFETQYNELAGAIDVMAERLRALGTIAPGTYDEFAKLARCKQVKGNISTELMIKHLIKQHKIIVETAKSVCDNSILEQDEVSLDLATSRIAMHEKFLWMLSSIIK
jgi:starvation-inducible DNA-binding protein